MLPIRRAVACVLLFGAGLAACYEKDDYSLTESRVAGILSLESVSGATTLPADGVSRLELVAKISGDTEPDKRDIIFTASGGTLVGGAAGTATGERVVTAAANGRATIVLQSTTQVQTVVVTAKIKGVDGIVATRSVEFVAITADDIIRFVVAPSSAVADGFSLSTFTVAISPTLPVRSVQFTASAGTFVSSGETTATVPVSTDSTASAILRSPTTTGVVTITATSNNFTRTTSIRFMAPVADEIIRFTAAPDDPVPADGQTLSAFTVRVAPALAREEVTFTSSLGTFVDSTVNVQVDFTATGHLRSPSTIGTAEVTATIGDFTRSASVSFERALPDRVTVNVDANVLRSEAATAATVTAQLLRDVGNVTVGTVATFTATDAQGRSVGRFSRTQVPTPDATGTVTTTFFPGEATAPGPVTLTVSAPGSDGQPETSSVVVQVVD